MEERGAVVVVLVLLGAAVAAVLGLTPVPVPLLALLTLLAPVCLYQHVQGERVLSQLQLRRQLLLLGLQLLENGRGLGPLPRLHQVSLLQNVQLQLLHNVSVTKKNYLKFLSSVSKPRKLFKVL